MARPFILGLDAKIYHASDRANLVAGESFSSYYAEHNADLKEICEVQDLSTSISSDTSEVTSRCSGRWKQFITTLKEATLDFTILWKDEAASNFAVFLNMFTTGCPEAFAISDTDLLLPAAPPCGGTVEYAQVLWADWVVTSFDWNQELSEPITADVSLQVGLGIVTPEWAPIPAASLPQPPP